jgi:hypothetical protein
MRDSDGFVLCHHGRPIRCLECGDEYEAELSLGVDGGPSDDASEKSKPANADALSPAPPASSPPEPSDIRTLAERQRDETIDYVALASSPPERSEGWRLKNGAGACPHCHGRIQVVKDGGYVVLALPPEPSNG